MDDNFLKSLCMVIKVQVALQNEVRLEGSGVFRAEHHKQHQQQFQDGRVVMMPPKDTIKFVADGKREG